MGLGQSYNQSTDYERGCQQSLLILSPFLDKIFSQSHGYQVKKNLHFPDSPVAWCGHQDRYSSHQDTGGNECVTLKSGP